MDGSDGWSDVAEVWSELWGDFAAPVHSRIIAAAGVGEGTRVLDVGCGSGELLRTLAGLAAVPAGIDPAPGMVALAQQRAPRATVRSGSFAHLPWPDGAFDVVTAVNSLQFAPRTGDALREAARVTTARGLIAIANWAEGSRNDLDVIEAAVARADGEERPPDGELRHPGGLERVLREAGLDVVESGMVEVVWQAGDDRTLVRGVLMGEDADVMASAAPTVLAAAESFRAADGSYRLVNAFRYAVARAA